MYVSSLLYRHTCNYVPPSGQIIRAGGSGHFLTTVRPFKLVKMSSNVASAVQLYVPGLWLVSSPARIAYSIPCGYCKRSVLRMSIRLGTRLDCGTYGPGVHLLPLCSFDMKTTAPFIMHSKGCIISRLIPRTFHMHPNLIGRA